MSMKVLVLSDLHVEFAPFVPEPAATAAADVVVLAGDIHKGAEAPAWARKTFPDKPLILIAGNHELYGGHWDRTLEEMRESALKQQVHFLENDSITIDGVQFLGATLWTDFAYFGLHKIEEAMAEAEHYMADYRAIDGCSPLDTVDRHVASRKWLERELAKPGEALDRVVVTHHYPRRDSTAAQYQNDLCTAAFGSQLSPDLLEGAGLWIHGHTHSSAAYRVGQCRVVCNPRGYPVMNFKNEYENSRFSSKFLMEQTPNGQWAQSELRGAPQ